MSEQLFGIAIEASSDLQRQQVQAAVKQNAESWWHGMADFWLVTGKSAAEWRDLIGPIFPTVSSGKLLVVAISGGWAFRAKFSDSESKWLYDNL